MLADSLHLMLCLLVQLQSMLCLLVRLQLMLCILVQLRRLLLHCRPCWRDGLAAIYLRLAGGRACAMLLSGPAVGSGAPAEPPGGCICSSAAASGSGAWADCRAGSPS